MTELQPKIFYNHLWKSKMMSKISSNHIFRNYMCIICLKMKFFNNNMNLNINNLLSGKTLTI